MTPQLVDLNADGTRDLVMATFEGTAFLVEGSVDGWKEPVHIKDKSDSNVRISMYYDMEENQYSEVDRSTDEYESNPAHHMTSIALVDWDDDGDQDLILGAYEGPLYLCLNEGTASQPEFAETNQQIMAADEHMSVPGGLATPRVVDWDEDGLFDLLCGGSKGGIYFYRNVGAKGEPKFAAAETLIGKTVQPVSPDGDAEDGVASFYASMMVPSKDGHPQCPGSSFHFDVVDYDGDGDKDLLIGAQSYFAKEKKKLTEDEEARLAELRTSMDELQKKMMKLYEGKEPDEMREIVESEAFQEMNSEMSEYYMQIEELQPSPRPANYIWLYRNQGSGVSATVPDFESDEFAVKATIEPTSAKAGEQVILSVQVHVPEGHHVYGSSNATAPTRLGIADAGGLELVDDAAVPAGRMVMDSGKPSWWLENTFTIRQSLKVPVGFQTGMVKGHVEYMICNERGCLPPAKENFSVSLELPAR